jgi:hypothetical protein
MKHLMITVALLSGTLAAQSTSVATRPQGTSPAYGPNYSQRNCAGFVSRKPIAHVGVLVGSKDTPQEGQFIAHSKIFLQGKRLQEDQRYRLLREVLDPNQEESSPEQRAKLHNLGVLYQEVGWVTVKSIINGTAVASFDFACDTAIVGDIAVPYEERPEIGYRKYDPPMEAFRAPSQAPKGSILGAKDFVQLLGTGGIVYTDFGASKGAKPGDYLVVLRGYAPENLNSIDRLSEMLPKGGDPARVNPGDVSTNGDKKLPHQVIGEMLVLYANAESSTALITRSFADMELGDVVQNEEASTGAAPAAAAEEEEQSCESVWHPQSLWHRLRHLQLHDCKSVPAHQQPTEPITPASDAPAKPQPSQSAL